MTVCSALGPCTRCRAIELCVCCALTVTCVALAVCVAATRVYTITGAVVVVIYALRLWRLLPSDRRRVQKESHAYADTLLCKGWVPVGRPCVSTTTELTAAVAAPRAPSAAPCPRRRLRQMENLAAPNVRAASGPRRLSRSAVCMQDPRRASGAALSRAGLVEEYLPDFGNRLGSPNVPVRRSCAMALPYLFPPQYMGAGEPYGVFMEDAPEAYAYYEAHERPETYAKSPEPARSAAPPEWAPSLTWRPLSLPRSMPLTPNTRTRLWCTSVEPTSAFEEEFTFSGCTPTPLVLPPSALRFPTGEEEGVVRSHRPQQRARSASPSSPGCVEKACVRQDVQG